MSFGRDNIFCEDQEELPKSKEKVGDLKKEVFNTDNGYQTNITSCEVIGISGNCPGCCFDCEGGDDKSTEYKLGLCDERDFCKSCKDREIYELEVYGDVEK